jgi:hypothetical protein
MKFALAALPLLSVALAQSESGSSVVSSASAALSSAAASATSGASSAAMPSQSGMADATYLQQVLGALT